MSRTSSHLAARATLATGARRRPVPGTRSAARNFLVFLTSRRFGVMIRSCCMVAACFWRRVEGPRRCLVVDGLCVCRSCALGVRLASLIDYAVLSLVIERPSYGYRMREEFEQRFGGFLSLSQSNLYDSLKRLEGQGYIEVSSQGGSRGRPRINYRSTAAGVAAYRAWLADRLRDDPQRLELLSRLASTGICWGDVADLLHGAREDPFGERERQVSPGDPSGNGAYQARSEDNHD